MKKSEIAVVLTSALLLCGQAGTAQTAEQSVKKAMYIPVGLAGATAASAIAPVTFPSRFCACFVLCNDELSSIAKAKVMVRLSATLVRHYPGATLWFGKEG
jgi:hypothetical protein